jgi:WD40 repeat protein
MGVEETKMFEWSIIAVVMSIIFATGSTGVSPTRNVMLRHGKRTIESIRFVPNGKGLVSASIDGTVVMWDPHSARSMWRLDLDDATRTKSSHTVSEILSMDVAPDGNTIAVSYSRSLVMGERLQGKDEYLIGLLDANTGKQIRVLSGHIDQPERIIFSPDGQSLLSESRDHTARLWKVHDGTEVFAVKLNERGAAIAFSPDGKVFAVATQPLYGLPPKPIVALYDARTGSLLHEFPRRTNVVTSLAFSSDGTLAVAGGNAAGAQIDLWSTSTQEPKTTFPATHSEINDVAFSKDGRLLALGGYRSGQGLVEVHDLSVNGGTRTYNLTSEVTSVDFSSDGRWLAAGTNRGEIKVLDLHAR